MPTSTSFCFYSMNLFRWEIDNNYCKKKVLKTPPYDSGPRLLDIMDTAMFDFLIGQLAWYQVFFPKYTSICLFSINTQVIIQNRALSLARYLGLSADNHLDGQNGCQ